MLDHLAIKRWLGNRRKAAELLDYVMFRWEAMSTPAPRACVAVQYQIDYTVFEPGFGSVIYRVSPEATVERVYLVGHRKRSGNLARPSILRLFRQTREWRLAADRRKDEHP